jgi:cysteine synthase A
VLADPYGSALYSYVKTGELATEGDSVAEGIGIKRIVANFAGAPVDDAVRVDDRTMVEMAHWLLREEGLFVGGSAALNVAAAARYARGCRPQAAWRRCCATAATATVRGSTTQPGWGKTT